MEEREAENGHYTLQTCIIVYNHIHGLHTNRQQRPAIAWYGDMYMLSHAWGVLKGGPIDVRVRLGDPISIHDVGDRKKLAVHAYQRVRRDFSQLLTGRAAPANALSEQKDTAGLQADRQ